LNLQVLKFDFCAFLRPYQVYVATAIGNECFLGASIAKDVGEKALQDAYQVLKKAGTIEAVYKLSVNDNGAIWLKDQATVEIYGSIRNSQHDFNQ